MTEPAKASLGARLLATRRQAGLTREELAVRTGLSWPAIAQIESGRRASPRADTLSALAGALGVSTDFLLGREASPLLRHHALIYSTVEDFVDTAAPFVEQGAGSGEAVLVVTTPPNVCGLRDRLGGAADGVRFEQSDSWYGSPREAFTRYRDFVTRSLAGGAVWVRIIGEPFGGGRAADLPRWSRYESLITLAFASEPVILACPYDESALAPEIVAHARATHCTTLERGRTAASAMYRDPVEVCLGK
jgi:transcriptional regulator with XRE-family HTH domain